MTAGDALDALVALALEKSATFGAAIADLVEELRDRYPELSERSSVRVLRDRFPDTEPPPDTEP